MSDRGAKARPGSSQQKPRHRPAARVLLIDPSDRLLLFRVELPRLKSKHYGSNQPLWITPGGGLEGDESFEEAARRELWEETGITSELGPCVWVRRHVFEFQGVWLDEVERFFVVRLDQTPKVSRANWLAHEHSFMTDHRWWHVAEIGSSTDYFAPRLLSRLLPPLLAGQYPSEPIDSGV